MRYLKVTKTVGIAYRNNESSSNLIIKGHFDFKWAGDQATTKSISNFIFMLDGGPIN